MDRLSIVFFKFTDFLSNERTHLSLSKSKINSFWIFLSEMRLFQSDESDHIEQSEYENDTWSYE